MSQPELQRLVLNSEITSVVEGVGHFFLVEKGKRRHALYLFTEANELVECANVDPDNTDKCFNCILPLSISAINPSLLFVLAANGAMCFLATKTGWKTYTSNETSCRPSPCSLDRSRPVSSHGAPYRLRKLRQFGNFDFTIVCQNGEIQVHSLVLCSQWPFFNSMKQSNMNESLTNTLTLDYPAEWIEALVFYLYEERVPLEFDTALGLLEVAQVYDLPDLLNDAIRRIKQENMDANQTLRGLKQAIKVGNEPVREYFSRQLRRFVIKPTGGLSGELLESFTQEEFVMVFRDWDKLAKE